MSLKAIRAENTLFVYIKSIMKRNSQLVLQEPGHKYEFRFIRRLGPIRERNNPELDIRKPVNEGTESERRSRVPVHHLAVDRGA